MNETTLPIPPEFEADISRASLRLSEAIKKRSDVKEDLREAELLVDHRQRVYEALNSIIRGVNEITLKDKQMTPEDKEGQTMSCFKNEPPISNTITPEGIVDVREIVSMHREGNVVKILFKNGAIINRIFDNTIFSTTYITDMIKILKQMQ